MYNIFITGLVYHQIIEKYNKIHNFFNEVSIFVNEFRILINYFDASFFIIYEFSLFWCVNLSTFLWN